MLAGITITVPAKAKPLPTSGSICTLVASVTFQTNVAGCSGSTVVVLVVKATIVGAPEVVVLLGVDVPEQAIKPGRQIPISSRSETRTINLFILTSVLLYVTEYKWPLVSMSIC